MDTSISPSSPTFSSRQTLASLAEEEHPRYHFYDGSLAFQLDGLKYCIHGSLLARHCAFTSTWADDLRDPVAAGIKSSDLEAFLSMLYLASYETLSLRLSADEWISILHLATRWKADGMRGLAISMLTVQAPALDKLVLCRTYDIPSWLAPACAALALRPTALTIPEAENLEKSDIVRVFLAREAVSKGEIDATEAAVSSWLAAFSSASAQTPLSAPPLTTVVQPISQPFKHSEASEGHIGKPETTERISPESSQPHVPPATAPPVSIRIEAREALLSGTAKTTGVDDDHTIKASSLAVVATSTSPGPVQAPPSEYKLVNEFVNAIRAKRYDHAFALSWNKNHAEPVARRVSDCFIDNNGRVADKELLSLTRAAIRRSVKQPGYIPIISQLLASLSIHLPQDVQFETLLHDDMQSLSSRWTAFRAGATPAVDHGGLMDDLATQSRDTYQQQMGNVKGLFRSLVRLGVLPESDQWVGLLVK
ncbi:unnamed protein product [Peniophora sp. CBMAI 1063]|nr:unnamed protein product [Peniophora sp. CBMAI 1063]